MKKLILLCMVFVFSNTFYAQTAAEKKAKAKTEKKIEKAKEKHDEKVKEAKEKIDNETVKAKEKIEKAKKDNQEKVKVAKKEIKAKTAKTKKDGTPDMRFKDAAKDSPKLKKDGTPDKRYIPKDNNASAMGEKKSAEGKAKAATNKVEAKAKKVVKERVSNEKAPRTPDKVTGMYKGKKVFTGPRGGRYYINSNGNKTYISDDK